MNKGFRQKPASAIGPVLIFAFALYLPSVRNDFIYDDHQLILEQPTPQSVAEIFTVFGERHWYNLPYYRPLARLTMAAQKHLHDDKAVYFHLFNTFLIAATALMAFELLRLPVFGIKPSAASERHRKCRNALTYTKIAGLIANRRGNNTSQTAKPGCINR